MKYPVTQLISHKMGAGNPSPLGVAKGGCVQSCRVSGILAIITYRCSLLPGKLPFDPKLPRSRRIHVNVEAEALLLRHNGVFPDLHICFCKG